MSGEKHSKPTASTDCPDCGGTKHILVRPGVERACECLKKEIWQRAYHNNRLQPSLWPVKWHVYSGAHPNLSNAIKKAEGLSSLAQTGGMPIIAVLTCGPDQVRYNVATLMVRDCIKTDMITLVCRLQDLINVPFDDGDSGLHARAVAADVLWIRTETAPHHSWKGMTLEKVMCDRYEAERPLTILTSRLSLGALRDQFSDVYPIADEEIPTEVAFEEES